MYMCQDKCRLDSFKQKYKVRYSMGGTAPGFKREGHSKLLRPYIQGYKRCKTCQIFVKSTDLRCSCCSVMFRTIRVRGSPTPVCNDYATMTKLTGAPLSLREDILLNKDRWNVLLSNASL